MPLKEVVIDADHYDAGKRSLAFVDDTGLEVVQIFGLNHKMAVRLHNLFASAINLSELEEQRDYLQREVDRLKARRRQLSLFPEDEEFEGFEEEYDDEEAFVYDHEYAASHSCVPPKPTTQVVPYSQRPAEIGERETRVRQAVSSMRTLAEKITPEHLTLLVRRGPADKKVQFTTVLRMGDDPRFEVPDLEVLGELFDRGGRTALDGLLKHFIQHIAPALKAGKETEPLLYTC